MSGSAIVNLLVFLVVLGLVFAFWSLLFTGTNGKRRENRQKNKQNKKEK